MDELVGKTFGRYRIEAPLGRGGMASVYLAADPAFGRTVAIKIVDPGLGQQNPRLVERFLREARAIARLQHPHILPVYDVGEQGGEGYLVMQYVTGGTLRDRLRGPRGARVLAPAEAVALLAPVGAALDYAHRQGVLHRDVKPTNVLLAEQDHPFLADFGLAKGFDQEGVSGLTATGMMIGTPEYMSPEQGQGGALDGRSDLYSLAVVLYEALTGRTPFRGETANETPVSIVVRHVTAPPPSPRAFNPALSPAVEAVLLRALAKAPDERYPTAGALFAALREALAETAAGVRSDAPTLMGATPPPAAGYVAPTVGGAPPSYPSLPTSYPATPTPYPSTPPSYPSLPPVSPPGGLSAPVSYGTPPPATPPPAGGMPAEAPRRGAVPAWLVIAGAAILLLVVVVGIAGALALRGGGGGATGQPTAPPGTAVAAATAPAATSEPAATTEPTATAPAATATTPPAATNTAVPTAVAAATAPAPTAVAAGAATPGRREVILFSADRPGVHNSQIYVMNPDGSDAHRMVATNGHSWAPRIAPDGRTFVFSVVIGAHNNHSASGGGLDGTGTHNIFSAHADGSNITQLTQDKSWDNVWSWSPDGKWVAFTTDRDGNWEIYKMTPDGKNVTRITNDPANEGWPAWTHDGKHIVFSSNRDGIYQLYMMDEDGKNVRRLTHSETDDSFPAISPDGTKIVYTAYAPGSDESRSELYLMDIDGSNATRLTSTVALNATPCWSPDGKKIAFFSNRDGNSNIYTMNADGSDVKRLTVDGDNETPSWGYLDTTPATPTGAAPGGAPPAGDPPAPPVAWAPPVSRATEGRARRAARPLRG
ncbi:MAG TPA: protein kinase [Thermomicrobiales bacterium]|nr:protein kinase [Thermomicrobiales bacterium]